MLKNKNKIIEKFEYMNLLKSKISIQKQIEELNVEIK